MNFSRSVLSEEMKKAACPKCGKDLTVRESGKVKDYDCPVGGLVYSQVGNGERYFYPLNYLVCEVRQVCSACQSGCDNACVCCCHLNDWVFEVSPRDFDNCEEKVEEKKEEPNKIKFREFL